MFRTIFSLTKPQYSVTSKIHKLFLKVVLGIVFTLLYQYIQTLQFYKYLDNHIANGDKTFQDIL